MKNFSKIMTCVLTGMIVVALCACGGKQEVPELESFASGFHEIKEKQTAKEQQTTQPAEKQAKAKEKETPADTEIPNKNASGGNTAGSWIKNDTTSGNTSTSSQKKQENNQFNWYYSQKEETTAENNTSTTPSTPTVNEPEVVAEPEPVVNTPECPNSWDGNHYGEGVYAFYRPITECHVWCNMCGEEMLGEEFAYHDCYGLGGGLTANGHDVTIGWEYVGDYIGASCPYSECRQGEVVGYACHYCGIPMDHYGRN